MRIAISGAGIAGPTLAYWLRKSSHDVLLIEEMPELRSGGYVIDFWGIGYDIAERMGLIPRIRELGYQVREVRFVDGRGRTRGGFYRCLRPHDERSFYEPEALRSLRVDLRGVGRTRRDDFR